MSVQLNFNAEEHFSDTSWLPVSDTNGHIVEIESADFVDSQTQGNQYLCVVGTILHGELKGTRGIINRFNLINGNEKAVQIANRELSRLAYVIGKPSLGQTDDLIGGQLRCFIIHDPKDPQYFKCDDMLSLEGESATTCRNNIARGVYPKRYEELIGVETVPFEVDPAPASTPVQNVQQAAAAMVTPTPTKGPVKLPWEA